MHFGFRLVMMYVGPAVMQALHAFIYLTRGIFRLNKAIYVSFLRISEMQPRSNSVRLQGKNFNIC